MDAHARAKPPRFDELYRDLYERYVRLERSFGEYVERTGRRLNVIGTDHRGRVDCSQAKTDARADRSVGQ
jgi:hypothetical protein